MDENSREPFKILSGRNLYQSKITLASPNHSKKKIYTACNVKETQVKIARRTRIQGSALLRRRARKNPQES